MMKQEVLKKYGVPVIFGTIVFLLLVLVLILFLRKDTPDSDSPTPSSGLVVVKQPLGYHKNYSITISPTVVEKLGEYQGFLYPSFKIENSDNLSWVEAFVKDIGSSNLQYSKNSPTPELTNHYWESKGDSVSYNVHRNTLFFTFSQGFTLEKITFDPTDSDNVEKNLKNLSDNYFSPDFEYNLKEIVREGSDYRVNFSRVLDKNVVYVETQEEYLILTPDGRLKEGLFLLAEFSEQKDMNYPLIPSNELVSKISTPEYPKSVSFFNLDPDIEEEYSPYGYQVYSNSFLQEGNINLNSVSLVYLYTDTNQEILVPVFLFDGDGNLDVEGTTSSADFQVLSSAISSEYVFVESPSFFRQLESVN